MWDLDVGCKTFVSFISLQHWIRCCDVLMCQGGQTCLLFEVFCEGFRRSFAHLEADLRVLEGPCLGLMVVGKHVHKHPTIGQTHLNSTFGPK